ncbi:MAG: MFS transporter [Nitrospirae bacterium]|nr:MFS transporter [Nitrospirota bacterium]
MRLSPFRLLCATGLFAIFSSTISKSPVLPLFAAHLGADPSEVGFVSSVSAFTGVIFSIPAGIFSDRIGKRKMLMFSSIIFSTAPILYLFVTQIWELALVRFYHGFATAVFIPVAMAFVSELFHKERGEKLGWFSTATLIGRFMAPLIGGAIIGTTALNQGGGFTAVYVVCAIAGAITFFMALFLPQPAEAAPGNQAWAETFSAFKRVTADRAIVFTCAVEAAILFAYGTFETFLPLYAVSSGISTYEVGIFLSAQVITLALSKPMMGRFSDRHGRKPQIFAGALIGAACIGGFSLFSAFIPLLILSVAFGMSLSVVTSATSAYIADLSSREARGSAMGLLGSIMDIGHTTGPLFSGVVAMHFGYAKAFIGSSLVLIVFAGIFLAGAGKGYGRRRIINA